MYDMDYNSDIMQEYLALYVGDKFNTYYKRVWENNYDKKLFLSFNLPALFVPFFWLLYRKMYVECIIFVLIDITLNSLSLSFVNVLLLIAMGFLGNNLYLRNVKINLSKISTNDNILQYLKNRESVNKKAVVIIVIILIILILITLIILKDFLPYIFVIIYGALNGLWVIR